MCHFPSPPNMIKPNSKTMSWILGIALSTVVYTSAYKVRFTKYSKHHTCLGIQDQVLDTLQGMASELPCLRECTRNVNCVSVLYNGTSQMCRMLRSTVAIDEGSCGTPAIYAQRVSTMRKPCVTSVECSTPGGICDQSICKCSPGYVHNPSNDSCVESCLTYSTTFQRYKDYSLEGSDEREIDGISEEACKQACISETSFVCRSIDYSYYYTICHLSVSTAITHPEGYEQVEATLQFHHLERDCA